MAILVHWLNRCAFFLRNLFRALWVFFPGVLFLVLTLVCFWNLSQGKDLMVLATEHRGFFILFQSLLSFMVLVSWYAARTVAYAKMNSPYTAPGYLHKGFYKHMPRLIGFSLFTVIMLAFAQTPLYGESLSDNQSAASKLYFVILALSIPYYFILSKYFERRFRVIKLNRLFWITLVVIITGSVLITLNIREYSWLVIVMLAVLQACYLVLVVTRREAMDQQGQKGTENIPVKAKKIARFMGIPDEEIGFHIIFMLVSMVALTVYAICTLNVAFAVSLGSFPFVLLAFAVFMGFGFIVAFVSIRIGINIHLVVLFAAFLFGQWTERHRVQLVEKTPANSFTNKASLQDYFIQWVKDRDSLINRSGEYPVYFVLSDGGASRSGYWVASVLGKLEDTSASDFSKHLFCLSGASGGSVGNAAFYTLLRNASQQPNKRLPRNQSFSRAGKEYLRSDFLTYTLSRMLGHDFFVAMLPFSTRGDRATALTDALEWAPKDSVLLKKQLQVPFSELAVFKNKVRTDLPILCINTTRMQDGQPSVISTIDIDALTFNDRVDVLASLKPDRDMKLSTAVVLGASFPYVSPAGRIDGYKYRNGTPKEYPFYFVDGGYVDNSGAGVVHEMIIKLNALRDSICASANDTVFRNNCRKISFYVMHISNGPEGDILLEKVNPLVNDLAAPLTTLLGSYGVQTSINDLRLKSYLRSLYGNDLHYKPINLYRRREPLKYSMNWVISDRTLDSMDNRLYSPDVKAYISNVLLELKR